VVSYNALSGISDMRMHVFELSRANFIGDPEDRDESSAIQWVPIQSLRPLIADGAIVDGQSLLAVALLLSDQQH